MTARTVDLFQFGLLSWFGLLLMVILLRLLQGRIPLTDLLSARPGGAIDVERAQAFAVFLFVLAAYLIEGLQLLETMPARVPGEPLPSMPDISDTLLVLLTGSNGIYLAKKIASANRGIS